MNCVLCDICCLISVQFMVLQMNPDCGQMYAEKQNTMLLKHKVACRLMDVKELYNPFELSLNVE